MQFMPFKKLWENPGAKWIPEIFYYSVDVLCMIFCCGNLKKKNCKKAPQS